MTIKLEQIAKDMFVEYAYKETGKRVNWEYLSTDRKLAWMKEVVDIYSMVIDQIEPMLELKVSKLGHSTTYERAFLQGESFENFRCTSLINSLKSEIGEQFQSNKDWYDHSAK